MTRRDVRLPHETPGFEPIVLGVTEQDVDLPPLGESGVRALLREVPFEWALGWTARIDAELRNGQLHGRADAAQLQAVAMDLYGHPKWEQMVTLVADQRRALFNSPYLHALQRLLVLEAGDGAEERTGDRRRMQDAFLGICNVVSPASARPRAFERDHYVALITRSAVVNATESIAEAITRAYAIYYELPRRPGASAMPNYVAPADWEPDARRTVNVYERFMIGMAIIGSVGVWDDELPPRERPTGIPPGYLDQLAEALEAGESGRLERAVAGDRAFFRGMFQREKPNVPANASNSIPFQVRPLLAQAGGGHLLSSTNALASWMTRGVHYACLTPIEGTPAAQDFLAYVGRLFELYAVELLQEAHGAQTDVRVLGDQPYNRGSSRTSDVAVIDGKDLVLIEIEAHRFTKEALLSSDAERVLSELDTMIVSKARQIDECIAALRRPESPAVLPGVDMSEIERIWPVVVIEGGITQTALLWDHLDEQLGGALRQRGVEPLSVMSINELEAVAGLVEHGHRLVTLLRRWKFGKGRHIDFTLYASRTSGLEQQRRPTLTQRRWSRLMEEVNSVLGTARARLGPDRP